MSNNPLNPLFGTGDITTDDLDERMRRMQEDVLGLSKTFTVVASDVLPISWDGVDPSLQVATFTHNLGYVPAFFAYFDNGGNKQNIPYYELAGTTGGALVISSLNIFCNTSIFQVIFQPWRTPRPPLSLSIRFYLLREPSQ